MPIIKTDEEAIRVQNAIEDEAHGCHKVMMGHPCLDFNNRTITNRLCLRLFPEIAKTDICPCYTLGRQTCIRRATKALKEYEANNKNGK